MKNFRFPLVAMISLILIGCNKDEDIIIDNPDTPSSFNLDYEVVEYLPAPGQYVNENISGFDNITTMAQACSQAESRLSNMQYVSLGAWGGNIIVKFKNPIENKGDYDFGIAGNNFDSSNEPGIVWVMEDSNDNGLPDDEWYELRGSYYDQEGYQKDFWVTYYRPEAGKNTPWKDSEGNEGFINWMGSYHNQDFYYPNWVSEDSYTLYGSKLPARAIQNEITGLWSTPPFEWGYVDNSGSDMTTLNINGVNISVNRFKISDAMDKEGNSVNLKEVSFIKVQTAIMENVSILGENSTEICGFFPL